MALKEADVQLIFAQHGNASVDACRVAYAVAKSKLWKLWKYTSLSNYVDKSLDMSYPKFRKMVRIYDDYNIRLKYTDTELSAFLAAFTMTRVNNVGVQLKRKLSFANTVSTLHKANASTQTSGLQFNLTLHPVTVQLMNFLLEEKGMTYTSTGHRKGVNDAAEKLIADIINARSDATQLIGRANLLAK